MTSAARLGLITATILMSGCATLADHSQGDAEINYLRCEYRIQPLGIDITEPRLSWTISSTIRGQRQTAYQILVASSPENLENNKPDLWDSGKIISDRSNQIAYAGKTLRSRMNCHWKVRIWDKDGRPCPWSQPAIWTMGLLDESDFRAGWIGYDAETPPSHRIARKIDPLDLKGCNWVWFPGDNALSAAPIATRYFRRNFDIPADRTIVCARFRLIADNEGTLLINGRLVQKFQGWTPAYTLDITDKLRPGSNSIAIAVENQGDSANPAGLGGKLLIEFSSGRDLAVVIDKSFKTTDTERKNWAAPDFDDSKWAAAKIIAPCGGPPGGPVYEPQLVLPPPPYLRKAFALDKSIAKATVYASALGIYELQINGHRVGDDHFAPGWTDYPTRVYYQTYDVTSLLSTGKNAIGAILADGWYAGHLGFGRKREHYGANPRLLVQLEVRCTDGSTETIVTDKSWKAAYGPHLEADFLMGETYDARKRLVDFSAPTCDDSDWATATVTDDFQGRLQAYPGVTVKQIMQLKPQTLTEPKPGVYVFDMGQNFAGWVRLDAKGRPGDQIVLRFAEMLNPDGTIYTTNLREARCTDTLILADTRPITWQPQFTFHGFRYVEITGCRKRPPIDAVTGIVIHSDTPVVGAFECSDPRINQLFNNIVWSQRGNFIEVPTDCPQRDERLGWTGDAQIFARTATYNMDVAAFFTKWITDLTDAQLPDGRFPDVAPHKVAMGSGVAAWGDAGVICPWTVYRVYDDKRLILKHYEAMQKWVQWLATNSDDLIRPDYGYGDWVSINSDTPKDVISTAFFAYSTRLLSQMAAAIDRPEDARKYEDLFQQIKAAFNTAFVADNARIKGNTQTCYLLALHFDLLPKSKRPLAAQHLVEDLRQRDWHLSTGFVGLSYLLPTLTETGHLDIAYRLLM